MNIKKGLSIVAVAALLGFGFTGCGDDDNTDTQPATTESFSYFGETGPSHWADLSADYSTCSNGLTLTDVDPAVNHQSPVNFTAAATPTEPNFTLDVNREMEFTIENNGHAIEAVAEGSEDTLTVNGKTYTLAQFHFHAYSEHTVNNVPAAIETHFVFKAEDGSLAVLGVFVDRNATAATQNEELAKVFETTLPTQEGAGESVAINVAHILPAVSNVYNYKGSLTTPPCTEGVEWNVYTQHVGLTEENVVNFTKIYHNNYRPITGNW